MLFTPTAQRSNESCTTNESDSSTIPLPSDVQRNILMRQLALYSSNQYPYTNLQRNLQLANVAQSRVLRSTLPNLNYTGNNNLHSLQMALRCAEAVPKNSPSKSVSTRGRGVAKSRKMIPVEGTDDVLIHCARNCGVHYQTTALKLKVGNVYQYKPPKTKEGKKEWHKVLRCLNAHESQRCRMRENKKRNSSTARTLFADNSKLLQAPINMPAAKRQRVHSPRINSDNKMNETVPDSLQATPNPTLNQGVPIFPPKYVSHNILKSIPNGLSNDMLNGLINASSPSKRTSYAPVSNTIGNPNPTKVNVLDKNGFCSNQNVNGNAANGTTQKYQSLHNLGEHTLLASNPNPQESFVQSPNPALTHFNPGVSSSNNMPLGLGLMSPQNIFEWKKQILAMQLEQAANNGAPGNPAVTMPIIPSMWIPNSPVNMSTTLNQNQLIDSSHNISKPLIPTLNMSTTLNQNQLIDSSHNISKPLIPTIVVKDKNKTNSNPDNK